MSIRSIVIQKFEWVHFVSINVLNKSKVHSSMPTAGGSMAVLLGLLGSDDISSVWEREAP